MITNFEKFNEAQVVKQNTTDLTFNTKTLIQIIDNSDTNIGQAEIKRVNKKSYVVKYRDELYNLNKTDVSINIHGQAQSNINSLLSNKKVKNDNK
jgi:hypothetical protein